MSQESVDYPDARATHTYSWESEPTAWGGFIEPGLAGCLTIAMGDDSTSE